MLYQFKCKEHGDFEVKQPMLAEHKADCPVCHMPCDRIYGRIQWIWAGKSFRSDGSYRTDEDFACLKG